MGFINALIHYLTCVTRREKGTTMDLWQQVLIETKNKSKMHQGLAENVSTDIVNRFMIISDDCKRISKHVRVYNYLNPLTQSVISTLFLPTISLLNHTLRSWEYRIISPHSITLESSTKMMRIKEMITNSRNSWFSNKFSLSVLWET